MTVVETTYPQVSFVKYHPAFDLILGPNASVSLLATSTDPGLPLYHEACIYHQPSRSVFVTSNQLLNDPQSPNASTSHKHVKLFRIYDTRDRPPAVVEEVSFPSISSAMLNGGVNFDSNSILLCAQGSRNLDDPSGIMRLTIPTASHSDPVSEMLLSNFYDVPFNSVNDVIVHPVDGTIWFTDPCYGYHQGIRPPPQLPNQVYRFDRTTQSVRVVAVGFTRPNGLCFSPDLQTLYVTDTGAIHGSANVPIDPAGPSHIYAYDIVYPQQAHPASQDHPSSPSASSEPILTNRRTFAYAPGKIPDGIKCDLAGNVYAGCGDGIEIWNAAGVLLGAIKVDGGVANFCFGEKGTLYACNETRFWKVGLDAESVRGALLGI